MTTICNRRTFLAASVAGAAALGASGCTRRPALDGPPNIVVYMPDSMRADALGCYGGSPSCSPVMNQFARRSFVFEACYSQSNWTKPSVASIFTGMTPRVHKASVTPWRAPGGFEVEPRMLRDQFTTWAEAMQSLGYRTACFQTNPHPRDEFGFDRGFEHFRFEVSEGPDQQMLAFQKWIGESPGTPFFAFVHQIKPHGPYQPAAANFEAAHGIPRHEISLDLPPENARLISEWALGYEANSGVELSDAHNNLRELSPEGLRYFRMLYEAEIYGVDQAFATLLDTLEEHAMTDNTAVVLTSDHGEAFGERDYFGHGNFLFHEETRVPLLVHLPGQRRSVAVKSPVALFDLYPTAVALGGGQPSSDLMSKPLFDDTGALIAKPDRAVFAEMDLPTPDRDHWSQTMIQGKRSLMRMNIGEEETVFGFDLARDPGQTKRLEMAQLEKSAHWRQMIDDLDRTIETHRKRAAESGPPEFSTRSDEYEEELRSLGYV